MIVSYPNETRNYCIFSPVINERIKNGESELPAIKESLKNPKSEDEVVEDLFILNCLIDEGVEPNKVAELYPELSKYNKTDSPNIQTFLAGIYRKTKVPDAFGPLVVMLIQNAIRGVTNDAQNRNIYPFDPNEEIGGAILDYLA